MQKKNILGIVEKVAGQKLFGIIHFYIGKFKHFAEAHQF